MTSISAITTPVVPVSNAGAVSAYSAGAATVDNAPTPDTNNYESSAPAPAPISDPSNDASGAIYNAVASASASTIRGTSVNILT